MVRLPVFPPSNDPVRAFPGLEGLRVGSAGEKERHDMALYEHIFLARQDVTAQQVEALTDQIKSKIASLGGAVTKVEPWGLKSLAFRVKKNRKAHFTLLNIAAPSEAVVELERLLSINEDVIRFLTIRVEEHEAGPSAMLRRRDDAERDERGSRGPRGDRSDRGDRSERGDRPDRPPRRPRDETNVGVN
jgi:small subunit ribosomal protein S6